MTAMIWLRHKGRAISGLKKMKSNTIGLLLGAACFSLFSAAHAAPLSITNVALPANNCIFNTTCTVVVTDTAGTFNMPGDAGDGKLQSRTYPGKPPAIAAGDMAYEYRMDMTQTRGLTAVNCVTKFVIDFGPVVKLPYHPGALFDVFVITAGGIGTIGLSSADQVGAKIEFTFAKPVCPGQTSYFFGLASKSLVPKAGTAEVFRSLGGVVPTAVRIP
jgi:hypothetical protein